MRRPPASSQLDLFAPPPEPAPAPPPARALRPAALPPEVAEWARGLPPQVRLGTSSWSFPGWRGLVYAGAHTEAELARHGLAAYAAHPLLRTVGLDRTFYAPLTEGDAAALAAQVPADFRLLVKVWDEITLPVFPRHARYGERAGQPNPRYLDAAALEDLFLAPLRPALQRHCGPLVLEFSPVAPAQHGGPEVFCARLDAFLARLPRGFRFAVELRNPELMTPDYARVLQRHGVAHVYNRWSRTPSVERQRQLVGEPAGDLAVVRLMLPQGGTYAGLSAQFAPFDRLVAPDEATRQHVVDLVVDAARRGQEVYVVVNNKAEGSAPLTCLALAQRLVAALAR